VLEGTAGHDGLLKGAYVLREAEDDLALVLIGTGSEVSVCVEAADQLAADGVGVRVVSMPCWEIFEAQGQDYWDEVMPRGVPRLSVEAATTFGWAKWADDSVGIDRFGASAPGAVVMEKLGINADNVVEHARRLLGSS
jgi:transketolase